MISAVKNTYFEWLCDFVGGCGNHRKLLEILFDIDYYWLVNFDDGKEKDGLYLREKYTNLVGENNDVYIGKCKVLEVLVCLAVSCEDQIMHDRDIGDETYKWFWMMINNLGLMKEKFNDNYIDQNEENEVRNIVDNMLARRYGNDGIGSLFPCQKPVSDFNRMSLWLQLNHFLLENFVF